MQWSEFNPYVLPYVMGASNPLIEQHVRLASIDWCRRTACHQASMDPLISFGSSELEMEADTGLKIIKIKAVAVDGKNYYLVDSVGGLLMVRSQSPEEFCFTRDNKTLHVYPAPVAGITVVVDAILTPTITATSLDDIVGADYLQDIALGAIASLQRVPGQPFSDLNSSAVMQGQYQARVASIAAKVARGLMANGIRSHVTYL
jgi:hypothetical protein